MGYNLQGSLIRGYLPIKGANLALTLTWKKNHIDPSNKAAVPSLFDTRDWFRGRQFFHRPGAGCGDGFGMI